VSVQDTRYQALLVTGAAGFLGRHMLAHLREAADAPGRVVGADLRAGQDDASQPAGTSEAVDLTDLGATRELLARLRPDGIIHLAGLTRDDDLDLCLSVNVCICHNIIAAASDLPVRPRVLVVSSAAQYGIVPGDAELVEESHPLAATTAYGVSKIMQEKWALAAGARRGVPVVCVRPFNILGPGQPGGLVPATFLQQAAAVLQGRADAIRVGNTQTRRDFTDVRDVVAAMWALMRAGAAADGQVFNIASGQPARIQDMLDAAIRLAGREIAVVRDPDRLKAADVPTIVGDATRLRKLTGWQCRIPWEQSMREMWEAVGPRTEGD